MPRLQARSRLVHQREAMTRDLATFVVSALVALGCALFLFFLLAGAFAHRAWSRDRRKRGARYLP